MSPTAASTRRPASPTGSSTRASSSGSRTSSSTDRRGTLDRPASARLRTRRRRRGRRVQQPSRALSRAPVGTTGAVGDYGDTERVAAWDRNRAPSAHWARLADGQQGRSPLRRRQPPRGDRGSRRRRTHQRRLGLPSNGFGVRDDDVDRLRTRSSDLPTSLGEPVGITVYPAFEDARRSVIPAISGSTRIA